MVLGSGSHSHVSAANPWVDRICDFQVPPTGWSKLAVSNRRGTVLLLHCLKRWIHEFLLSTASCWTKGEYRRLGHV